MKPGVFLKKYPILQITKRINPTINTIVFPTAKKEITA